MKYYLFLLNFLTPVHFGNSGLGGMLEKVELAYGADEFFSALTTEAANLGLNVQNIITDLENCQICHSSLFPYWQGEDGLELYVPRPIYRGVHMENDNKLKTYEEVKELATKLKKLKKGGFIRISEMGNLIKNLNNPCRSLDEKYKTRSFAVAMTSTHVNLRYKKPLPYNVSSYVFSQDAGMYFILGVEDDSKLKELSDLVSSLGMTGIGGKRSSGYGKFELLKQPEMLSHNGNDAKELEKMLNQKDGMQMNIAPVCPSSLDILQKEDVYKLKKCSGFVWQDDNNNMTKRNSFYMLQDGSCFGKRIEGKMLKIEVQGVSHSIYRNCKGMYLGVNDDE
ncbi:MAG: type III-A CRISPR-associated RAMP protein Csm4 [Phascolarctobacterium sp.]|nr:type III-A CRISPR-associated RAMP protein Csm4 [Candidatus Phascolarctobacterium caballi]